MKSIKPGRGPSRQAMVGGIAAALFGVFWLLAAISMGAYMMIPFGCIFIGVAVYNTWYAYRNATSEDRYSVVDIVDGDEEPDPMNVKYGRSDSEYKSATEFSGTSVNYCPYCGNSVEYKFDFCPKCGKKLPD